MGTDIINKIENLNVKRFSDYQYLISDIRDVIQSYDSANIEKLNIDKDHEGFFFRANSLDYIKNIFNNKIYEFITIYFYKEELIREVISQNPNILHDINIHFPKYFLPLFSQNIGRLEYGPSPLDKAKVAIDYFKNNYKSGYYLKPKSHQNFTTTKKSEGCFVATFAYESYNHPNVVFLRKVRDEVLDKSNIGKLFISKYYEYSPSLVKYLERLNFPKIVIKWILDAFILLIKEQCTMKIRIKNIFSNVKWYNRKNK